MCIILIANRGTPKNGGGLEMRLTLSHYSLIRWGVGGHNTDSTIICAHAPPPPPISSTFCRLCYH